MFALDLLRLTLADRVTGNGKVAFVDASSIGVKMDNTKRLEQSVQLRKDRIGSGPQDIGQDHTSKVINRMPQPTLVCFAAHKTPHLIHFGGLHTADLYRDRLGTAPFNDGLVNVGEESRLFFNSPMTVVGLICRTRPISLTPLPLRVISTI
jgi:hypothetical protein